MSPIPAGGRLLEPGDAEQGARRAYATDASVVADASAYGCLISTLRAEGSGPAYGYDAVYVHLSDRLVREAEVRMGYATFALRSEHAPAHAATAFNGTEGRGGIVRVARCRLPESAEVGALVKRALQEFGERSWVASRSAMGSTSASARASATTCAEWVEVWWCQTVTSPGTDYEITRCEFEGYECARYISTHDPPPGGGGGGAPPGGSDPDPCEYDGGATGQLCVGGPGGGTVPTDPEPDPCDTGYAVIDAPGFATGAGAAWEASNAQDPNPYARSERGGWIVRDPATEAISIVPFAGAVYTPCGIDVPSGTVPPNGAIGIFHTHPYAVGDYDDYEPCRRLMASESFKTPPPPHVIDAMLTLPRGTFPNVAYAGTPSGQDLRTVKDIALEFDAPGFFGVVADKDGFVVYSKDDEGTQPRSAYLTLDACAYDPSE